VELNAEEMLYWWRQGDPTRKLGTPCWGCC
jgi:hypothetical protein